MKDTMLTRNVNALVEALGDEIIAAQHLQSMLLRNVGGMELERALVKYDKAHQLAGEARWRCLGEPAYPALALALEEPGYHLPQHIH